MICKLKIKSEGWEFRQLFAELEPMNKRAWRNISLPKSNLAHMAALQPLPLAAWAPSLNYLKQPELATTIASIIILPNHKRIVIPMHI